MITTGIKNTPNPYMQNQKALSFKCGNSCLKINNLEKNAYFIDDATSWLTAIAGKLQMPLIGQDKKARTVVIDEGKNVLSSITIFKKPKMMQLTKTNDNTGTELTQTIKPSSKQERAAFKEVNEQMKNIFAQQIKK